MAGTSNQTWMVILISVVIVVLVGIVMTMSLGGDKSNLDKLGGVTYNTDNRVRVYKESKFKSLDPIYHDIPSLRILPANRMINELGIDTPQQVAQIAAIETAFLPRWKERLGQCNETIQQAFLKFQEAQKNSDQASMSAARKELADGVAAHHAVLEDMNKDYRQKILPVLNAEQASKVTTKPVEPSPLPKL